MMNKLLPALLGARAAINRPLAAHSFNLRNENSIFTSATQRAEEKPDIQSDFLLSTPAKHVAHLELNRPKVKNAVSKETASELVRILQRLDEDPTVRCLIVSGHGPDLTSGIDIRSYMSSHGEITAQSDPARAAKVVRKLARHFQAPFVTMSRLSKPIICVAHGICYGLGMELAGCCDIRYCTRNTRFAIREVRIGIAADVGSLQLMPQLVSNQSLLRELIYTGRELTVDEASSLGFVSRVCDTKEDAIDAALSTAKSIACRSPVAVQGSRINLTYSRDKSFEQGLEYNATWNMAMMQTGDVAKAMAAIFSKTTDNDDQQSDFDDF